MFKSLCLIFALALAFTAAHSQSLTSPIVRPHFDTHATELGLDSLIPGTSFKGFRLQGAGALYGVSFNPLSVSTSTIAVVYGVGWENDVWDNATQRFYTKFGVSLNGGPAGTVSAGGGSPGIVGILALTVSSQLLFGMKLPFKAVIGIAYNTGISSGSHFQAVTGPINGLNN